MLLIISFKIYTICVCKDIDIAEDTANDIVQDINYM